MVEEEEEELKKILNLQNKQINLLKDQVASTWPYKGTFKMIKTNVVFNKENKK